MNNVYIDKKDLNNYKKIKSSCNKESNLYINGKEIYKILLPKHRTEDREKNVELLSNYSHPNCVFPNNKIVDQQNNEFVGITIDYLDGYKTLCQSLKKDRMKFNKRKELAIKLCEVQEYLEKEYISFLDMHTNNVMIKDDDIKIIDLDSAEFYKNKYSDVFEHIRKDFISYHLSQICFLLLYGKDFSLSSVDSTSLQRLMFYSTDKQKRFLDKVFNNNSKIIDPRDYIYDFDKQYMEDSKLLLKR